MPPVPVKNRRAFREPIVQPDTVAPETPEVSFGDLVRMLAEGIADAQTALDRASADLVAELAATPVEVVPRITETVDASGNVTYDSTSRQTISLLELGVTPTFYQFSQATVEVAIDVKLVESETSAEQGKRFGLFAGTRDVKIDRKFNRDVTVASKLTATLVPVPSPLRLEPTRSTTTPTTPSG